jgi:hypothetical protein
VNDKSKQNSTIVIWLAAMVISIFALMNSVFLGSWVIAALAIPMGLAFLTTAVVWGGDRSHRSKLSEASESKKDNTAYSMALLMEMMDEDEREEFKYNLKNRILSGENVTNESLILDMEKRKRG